MRDCDVTVQKIKYHNRDTGYAVFEGMVLRWSKGNKSIYLHARPTVSWGIFSVCIWATIYRSR